MSALECESVKTSVETEGFYFLEDANVGNSVVHFLTDGLPFDSVVGLKLVQQNILEQAVRY